MSPADILDRRNDFRRDQSAPVYLVSRHVPPHPEQGRDFQHRVGAPAWRHPDHRLEDQAQTHASDDGAGRHKAPDGTHRGGRRLSRRRAERWQAWPWFARQDADCGCGRNHAAREANPPAVAPDKGFPPCRNRDLGKAGCVHQPIITGSGRQAALTPAFKWVNTTLGNIKSAITGTYRAIRDKHVPRYLAEFEYRFNRRYDLAAMMPRLGYVAVRTPPMPYRLLKLAEDHA